MTAQILFVLLVAFSPYLALAATILGFFIYLGVTFRTARATGRERAGRAIALQERS